jgi:hypothetical protein
MTYVLSHLDPPPPPDIEALHKRTAAFSGGTGRAAAAYRADGPAMCAAR